VWSALLFLLGFCGFILALIASIQAIAKTVKKRQWGWLLGLVIGVLGPLPAGFALSKNLINPRCTGRMRCRHSTLLCWAVAHAGGRTRV
jgi:hypothetical protein